VRRALPVVTKAAPIAVLLALALAAALVARDAAAIRRGLERSDHAFRAEPAAERLWRFETTLPFADEVFGVSDDLAFRRALRAFAVQNRPGGGEFDFFRPALRAEAQGLLSGAERSGLSADRRSEVVNLSGILLLDEAAGDPVNGAELIRQSIGEFQRAVRIDSANAEAKYNLEYVLRLMQPAAARIREGQNLTEYQGGRAAPGADAPREGHGY
jgi:hypothetical protein